MSDRTRPRHTGAEDSRKRSLSPDERERSGRKKRSRHEYGEAMTWQTALKLALQSACDSCMGDPYPFHAPLPGLLAFADEDDRLHRDRRAEHAR